MLPRTSLQQVPRSAGDSQGGCEPREATLENQPFVSKVAGSLSKWRLERHASAFFVGLIMRLQKGAYVLITGSIGEKQTRV